MKEDIYNFCNQISFSPEIENKERWGSYKKYVLCGMGGSHLQGNIFNSVFSDFPLFLHSDYGLPNISFDDKAIIVASYSGNTKETIDSYENAIAKNIPVIAISKGGNLLKIAKEKSLPYIKIPQNNVQPRMGIGYSLKSLLKAINLKEAIKETEKTANNLEKRREELREKGEKIASLIENKVPVIYGTQRNYALCLIWKINFNETSKIPSFHNIVPEMNHNEMTGFDIAPSTKHLSEKMIFINVKDEDDFPMNKKRMDVLKKVLEKRDFQVLEIEIKGTSRMEKVLSGFILSAWSAYYLAQGYGVDPEGVPMVEEFKKMI